MVKIKWFWGIKLKSLGGVKTEEIRILRFLESHSSCVFPVYLPPILTQVIGESSCFFSIKSRSSYSPKLDSKSPDQDYSVRLIQ